MNEGPLWRVIAIAIIAALLGSCVCTFSEPLPAPAALDCEPVRYLAVLRTAGEPCPTPGSSASGRWEVGVVSSAERPGGPRELGTICAYDWVPARECAPDLRALAGAGVPLQVDPPLVTPAQAPTTAAGPLTLAVARDAYDAAIDLGLAPAAPEDGERVGVAVVDTSPDASGTITAGEDAHGFNVAWLIRHLTCPKGGACATYPIMANAFERSGSRSVTTPSKVGQAVSRAVTEWTKLRTLPAGQRVARLVVNLSLAWESCPCQWVDPATFGLAEKSELATNLPTICVGEAIAKWEIARARCQGAIVIASAGNAPGSGPALPAAWEKDTLDCSGFQVPPGVADATAAPVLYAAGAVGPRDEALPITRDQSTPRLVAPSTLAVGFPDDSSADGYGQHATRSAVLTGTSVSAAAVSAVAAATWARSSEAKSREIMETVYARATALETDTRAVGASFCQAPPCGSARRVSMCIATNACEGARGAFAGSPVEPEGLKVIATTGDEAPPACLGEPTPTLPTCPTCFASPSPGSLVELVLTGSVASSWFTQTPSVRRLSNGQLRLYSARGTLIATIGVSPSWVAPPFSTGTTSVAISGRTTLPFGVTSASVASAFLTWTAERTTSNGGNTSITEQVYYTP
jgi:hypothetical protein